MSIFLFLDTECMSKYNAHKGILIQCECKMAIAPSIISISEKMSSLNGISLIYYLNSLMEFTHLV